MRRIVALVLISLLFGRFWAPPAAATVLQPTPAAQAPSSDKYADKIRAFEEFVRQQMEFDRTPGLTIGFMKDDYVWVKGFGYADLENRAPAKAESAYRLASVTKPMTAIAVLQLVEKGKIDLDAEVQTYVPYFPKKQWPVTVRQLLGHLGGVSHYKNASTELHIKERKATRDAIAIFENFDLVAEPGTRYSYSSYGYNLLGAVIEGASKQSYGDYMRENVWKPLGMNDTRMDDPLEIIPNRVRGDQLINGQIKNSEFIDISSRFAAGGTRSTVVDLLKFARGLNSGKLISKASLDTMYTSMTTRDGRLTDYGLGWQTDPSNGRFTVAHSGGQQETRTLLYIFPAKNFAIAAAINFESASPGPYVRRLFQLISDEPWELGAYTGDRMKDALYQGMQVVFNEGLAHFERHQQPLSKTPAEAAEAFAYFNKVADMEALRTDTQGTVKKIRDGRHPFAGHPFIKVGSVMASKLREKRGPERVNAYSGAGAIAFFNDYVEMYKADPNYPKELRFNEPFEKILARWHQSWGRTYTEDVRRLTIISGANLDAVGESLRKTFSGAEVYPSLVDEFFAVMRPLILRGDREKSLKVGKLAVDLYPRSDITNTLYAVALLSSGDRAGAQELLKKAVEIDAGGIASAGGLNSIAYQLAGAGRPEEGIELLKLAAEMHPREANLYDSIGEFYLNTGQKEKAVEYYRKALEVNPNFENAKQMLEKITK